MTDAVVASSSNPRRRIMDRNSTNHRPSFEAPAPQARELTEAELDFVFGGTTAAVHVPIVITKEQDCSSGQI
jgi:hypothetical protein